MSVKRLRPKIGLFLSLTVMISSVLTLAVATPASAATSGHELQLLNASSFCVDVKSGNDVSGQTVWLTTCASGNSEHWIVEQVPANMALASPLCDGNTSCIWFEDAQNRALCLSLGSTENARLARCDTFESWWVVNGGNRRLLRNIFWIGKDMAAVSASNESAIAGGSPDNTWDQWTGLNFLFGT
jgi:hypothetical protein